MAVIILLVELGDEAAELAQDEISRLAVVFTELANVARCLGRSVTYLLGQCNGRQFYVNAQV